MRRHLEIRPVTLSAAKGLARRTKRSFAALRMTARTPLKEFTLSGAKGSREAFSPNVYCMREYVDFLSCNTYTYIITDHISL